MKYKRNKLAKLMLTLIFLFFFKVGYSMQGKTRFNSQDDELYEQLKIKDFESMTPAEQIFFKSELSKKLRNNTIYQDIQRLSNENLRAFRSRTRGAIVVVRDVPLLKTERIEHYRTKGIPDPVKYVDNQDLIAERTKQLGVSFPELVKLPVDVVQEVLKAVRPDPIYARIEISNYTEATYKDCCVDFYSLHADVYVRFYSDFNCTTLYHLDEDIDQLIVKERYDEAWNYEVGYSVPAGQTEVYLGNKLIMSENYVDDIDNGWTFDRSYFGEFIIYDLPHFSIIPN